MAFFKKRPVIIEAVLWKGDNLFEIISFTNDVPVLKGNTAQEKWDEYCSLVDKEGLKIYTLEGKMNADIGDWIIKGIKGEFYPCKPDIFQLTYEEA